MEKQNNSISMENVIVLPLLAIRKPAPISSQRLKQIMAELSGQQERLATGPVLP